jgi:hypothetical protein
MQTPCWRRQRDDLSVPIQKKRIDPAARVDRNPRCAQRIDQDRELIIVRATGG